MVESLIARDWVEVVVGTDIREPGKRISGCMFYRRDIRDSMDDIFEKERIDTVVHTAYALAPIHNKDLLKLNILFLSNIDFPKQKIDH